ncbi:Cdc6/Cdc18 family protein [Halegenticoccus soli]|uniref:Cdc6/Cdc18 family protein n=1 Tax=Halegenticoccus soli TaxID=1985678 RepID=UPI000C6C8FB9|nr:AAA family ATPase [Halegenticoccus soli]
MTDDADGDSRDLPRDSLHDPSKDPLFGLDKEEGPLGSPIFANRDLLVVGTVPEEDRIVGRDPEIEAVANEIRHVVHGEQPNHVIILGETGTGKSLVTQHVSRRAVQSARALQVDAGSVYVECKSHNTETRVARKIAMDLESDANAGIDIPRFGLGSTEYFSYAYEILNDHYDGVIIILDEVDKLDNSVDILHELSRAREAGHTDAYIGIIAISNQVEYGKKLNARVESSMRTSEFVFEPYDARQLELILEHRRDAFRDEVLQDGVIPLTAEISADEHGDARKAVDILRLAGDLAERQDETHVKIDHIEQAKEKAEVDQVKETIEVTTPQAKLILYALAKLNLHREQPYRTSEIYDRYELVARDVRSNVVSDERVYQILKKMSLIGVTESTRVGGGPNQGVYLEHELLRDPDIVLSAVLRSDDRLKELEGV